MIFFYASNIREEECVLSREESQHAVRVVRLKKGDRLNLTDGRGGLYEALVIVADPQRTVVKVLKKTVNFKERDVHLHLAVALTENSNRYEWFVEKATEIGVEEITPIVCERCKRRNFRYERIHKVMISAMKQSLQSWLPVLHEPTTVQKILERVSDGKRYIATCSENARLLHRCDMSKNNVTILIGPEGDFTERELSAAKQHGFIPVSLGKNRLRTETAAIMACAIVNSHGTVH